MSSRTHYFFLEMGRLATLPTAVPRIGLANADKGKKPPVCCPSRLPPIVHTPLLIDCLLIIQNHYLLKL